LSAEFHEVNKSNYWNFSSRELYPVEIDIKINGSDKIIDKYLIVPWQNFQQIKHSLSVLTDHYNLFTVSDFAVIFSAGPPTLRTKEEEILYNKFSNQFNSLIDFENDQITDNENKINFPEGLQVISVKSFKYYVDIQAALPGSRTPADEELSQSIKNKMIKLQIIPDAGEIRTRWIKPEEAETNPYYTSVEDDLLDLFSDAIHKVLNNPDRKREVFENSKITLRSLFNAANSYVNFLYDKYENQLSRWLQLRNKDAELPYADNLFPGYVPKRTPDTAIDYMPLLEDEFKLIPEASADNILKLINLFTDEKKKAEKNPGKWIDGNMLLGAREKEYRPSKEELITAEIGDRIKFILEGNEKEKALSLISSSEITANKIDYKKFHFIHYDVMGSGRFFYENGSEEIQLKLK
jgi:hypothetical protein